MILDWILRYRFIKKNVVTIRDEKAVLMILADIEDYELNIQDLIFRKIRGLVLFEDKERLK